LVTAILAACKVLFDCSFSFDFDSDSLLLLLLLSLERERDFDPDLFRFLSLDVERDLLLCDRDLLLCNRDLEPERDLLPLDLDRDCLFLERDLRDLERDLDQRLLNEPTPLFQRGGENLRKFLNAGDFLRDLERDFRCLGDLDLDRLGDLDLDLLLYERERDRDFDNLLLLRLSLECDFDLFLEDLFLERDLDLDFFLRDDSLELDGDLDFFLVFLSLDRDLERLFLLRLHDLASGDFDLLIERDGLFSFFESVTLATELLLLWDLSFSPFPSFAKIKFVFKQPTSFSAAFSALTFSTALSGSSPLSSEVFESQPTCR